MDILVVHDDIRILVIPAPPSFSWEAGQYIYISFNHLPARPYSIASAPGDCLEIHIRRGKGAASAYVMDELEKGNPIYFSAATGTSIFNDHIQRPILALAGGLGIAPIKAITEQALSHNFSYPLVLYWGAADHHEHYIDDYFKNLARQHDNFTFIPLTGWTIPGVIHKEISSLATWHIYMSGAPAMIKTLYPVLLEKGAKPNHITYDRHPEAEILPS